MEASVQERLDQTKLLIGVINDNMMTLNRVVKDRILVYDYEDRACIQGVLDFVTAINDALTNIAELSQDILPRLEEKSKEFQIDRLKGSNMSQHALETLNEMVEREARRLKIPLSDEGQS